jgi:hypothetical protein
MDDAKQSETYEHLKILIGASAAGITLVTAFLFLSGYLFIDQYYGFFGLDVSALDFPAYYPLVTSIGLLYVIFPLFRLASIVLLMGLAWLLVRDLALVRDSALVRRFQLWVYSLSSKPRNSALLRNAEPKPNNSRVAGWLEKIGWLFFAFVISLVPLSIVFKAGGQQAQEYYDHPRFKTTLIFKTGERQSLDTEFLKENSEGGLRVLRQTKDFIVVFVKRELTPSRGMVVVCIPMENLVSVRNEPLP